MKLRTRGSALLVGSFFALACIIAPHARAQQTLGGITGTVTDASGAIVAGATVTLVGDQTKLTRSQNSSSTGSYLFVNLPIGSYTLTFTRRVFSHSPFRPYRSRRIAPFRWMPSSRSAM